ncbi:MAG: SGNH/GDSL hydrolase family protein [Myxococcota bacterium]
MSERRTRVKTRTTDGWGRRGGARARGLFAFAFACVLLGLAEVLARFHAVPDARAPLLDGVTRQGVVTLHGNPWLLWELGPGVNVEEGVSVRVNALGMRDRERGPKTGRRALALGDSSVYGFGVPDEAVFTAVLEAKTGDEFVNQAVPGHSTFQQLNLLRMRGLALDPDLLIVATLWSDNNFDTFVDANLLASYAGWEESATQRARAQLERSSLFRVLDYHLRVKPQGERARKVGWMLSGEHVPGTGQRRVALQDYADNLETFCRLMAARGGGVVFVTLPNRVDVVTTDDDMAWEPYRQAMADTAARWGAPRVDMPAVFRASGLSADELFLDEMHPTIAGHALMARAVEAALAPGWPVLTAPSGPVPTWVDPRADADAPRVYVERVNLAEDTAAPIEEVDPKRGPALVGVVALPIHAVGPHVLDAVVDGKTIGSVLVEGDGPVRLRVGYVPDRVRVALRKDLDGDGAAEEIAALPEQEVGPEETVSLDFRGDAPPGAPRE